jgi:hypothetical protein
LRGKSIVSLLDLDILTPKKQRNFYGEEVNGVFASSDPIWAMFFSIFI